MKDMKYKKKRVLQQMGVETAQRKVPDAIPISSSVLEKAYTLCELVKEVSGSSFEWFSFLLASKADPTYQVRDLMLVDGVEVTSGSVDVSGKDHAKAAEEVRQINAVRRTDYYIIGWLHSHGDTFPFHSPTDDKNFLQLLNSIAFNTEFSEGVALPLIESEMQVEKKGEKVIVTGKELEDGLLQYVVPDSEAFRHFLQQQGLARRSAKRVVPTYFLRDLLRLTSLQVEEPKITGFGYSIVVDEKRTSPYAEIGILEELAITGSQEKKFTKVTKAALTVIADEMPVERAMLKDLVEKRLRFPKKFDTPKFYSSGKEDDFYSSGEEDDYEYRGKWVGRDKFKRFPIPSSSPLSHTSSPPFIYGSGSHHSRPYDAPVQLYWEKERQTKELVEAFAESVKMYLGMAKTSNLVHYEKYVWELTQHIKNKRCGLAEAIQEAGLPVPGSVESTIDVSTYHYNLYYTLRDALEQSFQRDGPFIKEEKALMEAFIVGDKNTIIVEHVPSLLAKIHACQQEEQEKKELEKTVTLQRMEVVQRFTDQYAASLSDAANLYSGYLSDVLTELPTAENLRHCFQQAGKLYVTSNNLLSSPFHREKALEHFLRLAIKAPAEDLLFFEEFVADPAKALEKYVPLFVENGTETAVVVRSRHGDGENYD